MTSWCCRTPSPSPVTLCHTPSDPLPPLQVWHFLNGPIGGGLSEFSILKCIVLIFCCFYPVYREKWRGVNGWTASIKKTVVRRRCYDWDVFRTTSSSRERLVGFVHPVLFDCHFKPIYRKMMLYSAMSHTCHDAEMMKKVQGLKGSHVQDCQPSRPSRLPVRGKIRLPNV